MITKFVEIWDAKKDNVREFLSKLERIDYADIVTAVVTILAQDSSLDPKRITHISDNDYQGTDLFVLQTKWGSRYYYVAVSYGSCSSCDTIQGIYDDPEPTRLDSFMTLALHILQSIKEVSLLGD